MNSTNGIIVNDSIVVSDMSAEEETLGNDDTLKFRFRPPGGSTGAPAGADRSLVPEETTDVAQSAGRPKYQREKSFVKPKVCK